eukprot:357750-Hanusia_phi.AAC.1
MSIARKGFHQNKFHQVKRGTTELSEGVNYVISSVPGRARLGPGGPAGPPARGPLQSGSLWQSLHGPQEVIDGDGALPADNLRQVSTLTGCWACRLSPGCQKAG